MRSDRHIDNLKAQVIDTARRMSPQFEDAITVTGRGQVNKAVGRAKLPTLGNVALAFVKAAYDEGSDVRTGYAAQVRV